MTTNGNQYNLRTVAYFPDDVWIREAVFAAADVVIPAFPDGSVFFRPL